VLSTVGSIDLSSSDVSGILAAARFPALSGDLTSSAGSTAISLANTGVAAGTYNKVTVDAKGRVTSAVQATTLSALGITDAAALTGSSTTDFAARNLTVSGDILPAVTNAQNIGSAALRWQTIWVNEAKLSTNTLYIGETPILGTTGDTIKIKADPGQSIHMLTTTTGSTLITSENQVQISTAGMNADVLVQATGTGSKVRIGAVSAVEFTSPFTSFSGDAVITGNETVGGNLTVTGNLTVNGTNTIVNSTTVTTKDNIILVNSGEVGSGVSSGKAGIQVDRGDMADYQMVFDETDDMFKVGQVGNLETIASQNYVASYAAPVAHVGAGGSAHAAATGSVAGFMSAADKSKLDGVAAGANLYVHPTSGVVAGTYPKVTVDTNGHVTSGASLVAADIPSLDWSKISTGVPTTLAGFGISDAYTKTETDSRIQAVIGAAPAALDTLTELAAALGNDANFATTTTNALATKATITYVDSQIASVSAGNVASASEAAKLTTARSIGMTGDVTWSVSFDGSANVTAAGTLANSGVVAGTYPKVTVNSKGLITGGASLVASDIPSLDWSKITSGKPTSISGYGITIVASDIPTLDWSKISSASLPTTLAGYGITDSAPLSHVSDASVHLTSAQNTWLDAITASSAEVNYLVGVTSAVQTQLDGKQATLGFTPENSANKGAANGYASLGSDGKVPSAQLPSYVDDVLEFANQAGFPGTGETGKIYVALDTNKIYRWTGTVYIEISPTAGNSDTATKLATARTIALSGDVTGSVSFDGSANVTIAATIAADSVVLGTDTTGNYVATIAAGTAGAQSGTSGLTISATAGEGTAATIALSTTGVAAGTYKSVTVDAQGRITAGTNPTTLAGYGITDAYDKTYIDAMVVDGGTF
jgi:phage-related tail fiber protein